MNIELQVDCNGRCYAFLRAVLVVIIFGMSMLYLGTAKAGNVNWSIHFDWVIPHVQPHHGHGHGHGHNHGYVSCPEYYWQYGCNSRGFNCRVMPPQDCVGGRLTMPRPRHDHGHHGHTHTWRCYQRHWHGDFYHQHHADGHHEHGYNNR